MLSVIAAVMIPVHDTRGNDRHANDVETGHDADAI